MGAYCGEGEHVNIGHEGAGEIVAVAQSQRLKVGDRVALAPPISCGVCDFCQRGETIFCANRPPMSGCFAGYACVSDAVCTLIPDDIDTDRAALLGCALGPATEALRQLAVTPFDTVVVSGLGPVGLGATALAAFHGARVIGLDPEPFRRDLARRAGAELTLDPAQPDTRERLRTVAGPEGVRKAVECSGKEAAERLLLDVAGVRATLCIVGENHGTIPVSPSEDFIRKGLRVVGCWHMNVFEAPKLFEFLRRAAERADTLITHRFGFGRVQEAFDAFASGRCSKVILHPWE
jgi:threonine dehydrogenase-like Zn-dependent dehydrogenase